jgi:hypothetical protein
MSGPQDLFWATPELRNLVYREIFADGANNHPSTNAFDYNKLAVFSASPLLHLEASTYFYATTQPSFHMMIPTFPTATMLPPIADQYVRFLKHFDIFMSAGCGASPTVQETAKRLAALTSIGANFEEITFHIGAAEDISPLLNARLDDSVLDMSHPLVVALRHILETNTSNSIRIHLLGAWLATGVAAELQSSFGTRIQFVEAESNGVAAVAMLSRVERGLRDRCSTTPLRILSENFLLNYDSGHLSSASSDVSLNSFIGVDADVFLDEFSLDGTDTDTADDDDLLITDTAKMEAEDVEDDLSDLHDMDIDELLEAIDPDEVAAIMVNMREVEMGILDAQSNAASMAFMAIVAPEYL